MQHSAYLFLSTLLFAATPAYAYIDPGSAGLLYQVAYGLVAATLAWFAGIGPWITRQLHKLRSRHRTNSKTVHTRDQD